MSKLLNEYERLFGEEKATKLKEEILSDYGTEVSVGLGKMKAILLESKAYNERVSK